MNLLGHKERKKNSNLTLDKLNKDIKTLTSSYFDQDGGCQTWE